MAFEKMKSNLADDKAYLSQWEKMGNYLEILSRENESLEEDLHNGRVRRLKRQADEYTSNEDKPEQILASIHVNQRESIDTNFIDIKKKLSSIGYDYKGLKKDLNQILLDLNSLKKHRNKLETNFLKKNRFSLG